MSRSLLVSVGQQLHPKPLCLGPNSLADLSWPAATPEPTLSRSQQPCRSQLANSYTQNHYVVVPVALLISVGHLLFSLACPPQCGSTQFRILCLPTPEPEHLTPSRAALKCFPFPLSNLCTRCSLCLQYCPSSLSFSTPEILISSL